MKIVLEFDENNLTYTDSFLSGLWHAAQFNHAPADDPEACRGVELIGREIIRRWLASVGPELWHRQGSHEKSLPLIKHDAALQNVLRAARELRLKMNSEVIRPLPPGEALDAVLFLTKKLDEFESLGSKGAAP